MRNTITHRFLALVFALAVLAVSPAFGISGVGGIGPQGAGSKGKIKGVVTSRTPDGFKLKDAKFNETSVVLTDGVRVLLDGKPVTAAQRAELAKLVGGIIAQVEGHWDGQGQLVAEKISVSNKDVRAAQAVANRVDPVQEQAKALEARTKNLEQQQAALAGEVDELGELTKIAREEAQKANDRISALASTTSSPRARA
jgi:hypothetical protein